MRFSIFILLTIFLACSSDVKIENLQQINEQLYSGGAPKTQLDFNYLASQGIKSLISVDGARPDIEKAKVAGLKYLHVPYSYGKIDRKDQAKLLKAFDALSKPVYIHCHHGKHRAPAGAGIILVNLFSETPGEAVKMMESIGTSKDYSGLYKTVSESKRISEDEWRRAKVSEIAEVDSTSREMAVVDRHWDLLKLIDKNDWKDRKQAVKEIIVIKESFIELNRLNENQYMSYEKSLNLIKKLEDEVLKSSHESLSIHLSKIKKECKSCHRKFRD